MQKKYNYLIKVLKKEYLARMLDGDFRFGTPEEWRKNGHGKFDISEGVLAIEYCKPKIKFVLGQTRSLDNLEIIDNDGKRYIYDIRIDDIPTMCFFSIETDCDYIEIPDEFFEDFVDKKEEYGFAVIDAKEFNDALKEAITKFGFLENDLFFHSIKYCKKDIGFSSLDKFPYELLYKDEKKYSHQHEVRFFITNYDLNALKLLKKNNNIVTLDIDKIKVLDFYKIPSEQEKAIIQKKNDEITIEIIPK